MATRNKCATLDDLHRANKILKKAQMNNVKNKYSKLGKWDELEIVGYSDASYRNAELGTKSVGGRKIHLINKKDECSSLSWK